ncbi:hypothetical protein KDW_31580 [Dictyobacter vulcani]|uniref:Uncharacterized protein n=1 Tax=Dictyobacter vulcani TaxID=2607529 RepID=A0A5J4KUS8_9CHLR|nr:hypothetical protein KDW_31580 [Dictyobacter vulcani]
MHEWGAPCILIPERCFELRLVTALPVSLYDRERRQQVRHTLSQIYHCTFNGREREIIVRCGYVALACSRQAVRSISPCSLALRIFFSCPPSCHSGTTDGSGADIGPVPGFPHLTVLLSGCIGVGF